MKGTSQRRMLRDALVLIIVIISAYLLHGRYAQAVCNLCTALPACIFSYVQLSDRSTQLFAFVSQFWYFFLFLNSYTLISLLKNSFINGILFRS